MVAALRHDVTDKLPPQALEVERGVLGCLLLQPDVIESVLDELPPDAFYLDSHRLIYRACLALHTQGRPCDLMQVTQFLTDQGHLEQADAVCRGQVADGVTQLCCSKALQPLDV